MRKDIKTTEAIFPMPVLMVATYNEDGSVNVMNAAWGTMQERDHVVLNLTETHKTVQNIKARKAFTVSIADASHVVEADYFGVESGNKTLKKFENSGLTAVKSEHVICHCACEITLDLIHQLHCLYNCKHLSLFDTVPFFDKRLRILGRSRIKRTYER